MIERVSFENFLSFTDLTTIEIGSRGLVLVTGENLDPVGADKNGIGKSAAVCESITYGLFGKLLRHGDAVLGDAEVVNDTVGKNCRVAVDFTRNGVVYQVERFRKYGGFGTGVRFFANGEDISNQAGKDTQQQIEQALGINYDVWCSTAVIGQGKLKKLAGLTDKKQKEVIEALLGLDFDKHLEAAKAMLKVADGLLAESQSSLSQHQRALTQNTSTIEKLLKDIEQFENTRSAHIAENEQKITALKEDIGVLDEELSDAKSKLQEEEATRTLLEDFIKEFSYLDGKVRDSSIRCTELSTANRLALAALQRIKKEAEESKAVLKTGSLCPVCRQKLGKNATEEIDKHYLLQVEAAEKQCNATAAEIAEAQTVHKGLEQNHLELLNVRGQLDRCSKTIDGYRIVMRDKERRLDDIQYRHDSLEGDNTKWQNMQAPSSTTLEVLVRDSATHEEEITALQMVVSTREKEIEHLRFLERACGPMGVKVFAFESILPTLNEYICEELNSLTNGATQAQILSDNQKFSIEITMNGRRRKYNNYSGGEAARIDIAMLFAGRRLGLDRAQVALNYCGCDEPMENLDKTGVESVMQTLRAKAASGTIFVISQDDRMLDYFDDVVYIEHKNGRSKVVEK